MTIIAFFTGILIFALINFIRVNPLIDPSDNAVINHEGTIERINHWVNKMWNKGGMITDKIENKLKFLYENGRKRQVGMYLRNQNLLNPNFKSEYKSRSDCERTHSHMKHTFNFRVKWILYCIHHFIIMYFKQPNNHRHQKNY